MATDAGGGLLDRRTVLASAALLAAIAARVPGYVHELFDPDEASIATQAITMQRGGRLYVDTIDRKPPLPPVLYRWSFDLFGPDLVPLHVLAALALGVAAVALALDLRRRVGTGAGWWGLALFVTGAVAFLPTNAQAASYAHFALLPGTLAVIWARRGSLQWSLFAGVALGLAVLCRQTWALGLVPGVVAIGFCGSGAVWSRICRGAGFVAAAAGTVSAAALFVPADAFWHWAFSSNGGFVTSAPSPGLAWHSLVGNLAQVLGFHIVIVAAVAVLLVKVGRGRDRDRDRQQLDLWLWLLAGVVAAVAGFRFFGHYWLQCLPPAVLLSAPILARARSRSWRWLAGAAVAVPTTVAIALAFVPNTVRDLRDPVALVSFVRAHSTSQQQVLLWGNDPVVLWRADRPTAGAFVSSDFVVGLSGNRTAGPQTLSLVTPGARATMMALLRQHQPRLVLDTSTADIHDYAVYPLSVFPALDRFVHRHYRRVAVVDRVTIYAPAAP